MVTWLACFILLLAVPLNADNVELTSNKERQFTCPGDQVTFTCRVFGSFSLEWRSPLITRTASFFASNSFPRSFDRGPFTASLINVSTNGTFTNANITSTLQVTASRMTMRDETTVMCLSTTANETDNFTIAEISTAPLNVAVNAVRATGGGSVTIAVSWMQPQNFDQFDIDHYNISMTSTSGIQNITTACGGCTSTEITVSEDLDNVPISTTFNTTIAAVNLCGETGPTATASYTLINCGDPTPPMDGSIEPYQNTTEGAEIFFMCNQMFVPSTRMTATCISNGWTPDPGNLTCTFDCGRPVAPLRGSLVSYTSTTEGSEVFYRCDPGLVPEGRMRANCTRNGWSPNPADQSCSTVNCDRPNVPQNGIIENIQSISTVGGSQIFFRCSPGFVPAGRMSATCISPDGISVVGTWTREPAQLVCNVSDVDCGAPPTLASGVTVEAYNITAVSSLIFYQCQSGFTPSNNSSVCGEDGMWTPDPSQVTCLEEPTTMSSVSTPPQAAGLGVGAIAGIVVVVLVVVVLLVAVIIIMGVVWWRRQPDVSSKPPPSSDGEDVAMYSTVADPPEKKTPYKEYKNHGSGDEAEYTTVPDITVKNKGPSNGVGYSNITGGPAQTKSAEAQYDLPTGSDHPQGLVYAQVDVKPKKRTARPHDPNPPKQKEEPRVEYASIAYQPKDAAEKSQQAAEKSQEAADRAQKKTKKKHPDADQLLNLDNLLIQLQSLNAMWYQLGVALDLPDSILDDIKDQCRANPEQCMVEMVDAWMTRQMHVGKPTWTDLATGLRKINQTKLADALENIYNTGVLPITVNMTQIPESLFPADSGAPPPIPTRGTLTEDAETPPPKPPKSWGSPPATKTEPSVPPWPHRAQ